MAEINKDKVKQHKNPVRKLNGNSYNPQHEILEMLKSKCPEVITEGKIDIGKLKQTIGEELDTNNERYGLTWAGKSECFRHIQEATSATLKPRRDESVDFDTTENIFIEGDNLEVLKIMQKTYQNKIKMIYIDPPYNTGNDSFIYPDRFKEEKEDYEQRAGIKDAEGILTKDGFWRKNSKDAGHFHSNWLSMMQPRLFLARNLLKNDGVIFVSIDDNEVQTLKMVMDEIFGEENHLGTITVVSNLKGRSDDKYFATAHNYLVVYRKNDFETKGVPIPEEYFDDYPEVDEKRLRFRLLGLRKRGAGARREDRPNMFFPIYADPKTDRVSLVKSQSFCEKIVPRLSDGRDGRWRWGKDTVKERIDELCCRSVGPEKRFDVFQIDYAENEYSVKRIKPKTIWSGPEFSNEAGTLEVKALLQGRVFDNPKPIGLITYCLEQSTEGNDVVLDFFAGACTTAQAIMELNAADGGNRKFICVQLAEPCEEKSEAYKAGYRTIADIGKERIRRAAKKIEKEIEGNLGFDKNKLDLGFKVFRLDQSNFKQWRHKVKTGGELREQMRMFVDNVKKGAEPEDMLFEIILKNSRFDLNVKIEKQSFDGIDFYRLADGVEIVCLAERMTKKFVEKVLKEKPERFTCLDVAFKDNDQLKTNTALQMEAEKIDFKVI